MFSRSNILCFIVILAFSFLVVFSSCFFLKNTNANIDRIRKTDSSKEVVSSSILKKEGNQSKKEAKILFFGDLMLDRYNRNLADKNEIGWLLEKIPEDFFLESDMNIANLEGPVTDNQTVSIGTKENEKNHFVFTFDPKKTRDFLNSKKIGVVNIGNNHILNFGKNGLDQTKNNLDNFGVEYFGDPTDKNSFISKEINGIKIGFVNFNQFSTIGLEKIIENIKNLKKENNFVIVYTHWGDEYKLVQNKKQQNLAHFFIDSGADLIIGTHPHVIEPIEIYKNKAIFYSLGNFVFDQYFSEDVKERLVVGISISKEKTEFILEPLYTQSNGQVVLADEKKRNNLLSRLSETSTVSDFLKKEILTGNFSIKNW